MHCTVSNVTNAQSPSLHLFVLYVSPESMQLKLPTHIAGILIYSGKVLNNQKVILKYFAIFLVANKIFVTHLPNGQKYLAHLFANTFFFFSHIIDPVKSFIKVTHNWDRRAVHFCEKKPSSNYATQPEVAAILYFSRSSFTGTFADSAKSETKIYRFEISLHLSTQIKVF